ncbi:MAG: radical SAM protein [PVC group bacterium]
MTAKPSYLRLHRTGKLRERFERARELLNPCRLCPRECGVNRRADETGVCRTGRQARVASSHPHFGEEPELVGRDGSGTIFFQSCSLLCSFCQNYDISHCPGGTAVDPEQLAALMLDLASRGCHNINFVTPTHVVPQILEALLPAIDGGLDIPLVYNSSGYEKLETLRLLDGIVDIYLPDFKFWDNRWARKYCRAPDYRERACAAIREMQRQAGGLRTDHRGIARRGLMVRHLVMPKGVAGTAELARFLADEISPRTYLNIMAQYRPCGGAARDPVIGRTLRPGEYRHALAEARAAGWHGPAG